MYVCMYVCRCIRKWRSKVENFRVPRKTDGLVYLKRRCLGELSRAWIGRHPLEATCRFFTFHVGRSIVTKMARRLFCTNRNAQGTDINIPITCHTDILTFVFVGVAPTKESFSRYEIPRSLPFYFSIIPRHARRLFHGCFYLRLHYYYHKMWRVLRSKHAKFSSFAR